MQGLLLHADWLSDFPVGGPFPKVCLLSRKYVHITYYVLDYVHNHIPICTALLTGSLFWHLHRDNMVLVLAISLWILDLRDSSWYHLSKLSGTPDNIHIWAASTVSTTRDATLVCCSTALKLSTALSTLSLFYRQFSLTCHRIDRVILLATLTKNSWSEP